MTVASDRSSCAGRPFLHCRPTSRPRRHWSAASHPPDDSTLPDLDVLQEHLASHDPEWLTITFRGIGEMHGTRTAGAPSPATSWMNLSPYESDEYGVPRAYVHLVLQPADHLVWRAMDEARLHLAQQLAGGASNIPYLYDAGWQTQPFSLDRPFPEWHRGLGTPYHESGTRWMGTNPASSVTSPIGRFHRVASVRL
jgi:hypothetical protein